MGRCERWSPRTWTPHTARSATCSRDREGDDMPTYSGTLTIGPCDGPTTLPTNRRRFKMPDGTVRTEFRTNATPTRGYGTCGYCGHSWDQVESFSVRHADGGFIVS